MRISAGSLRGRTLKAPKGVELRPTEERVRQALFNILGPYLADADFLDVFAGSGAVGIEALSRGAKSAVFIDKDSRCQKSIEEHAKSFGLDKGSWQVLRGEASGALRLLANSGRLFDFVFLDPPYEGGEGLAALMQLGDLVILKDQASSRVVYEHARKAEAPEQAGRLSRLRQYPYGNSVLSFYSANDAN
jgi:16S rRNA (guanine(966)-N(2))-methyltransferase RsmD